MSVHPPPILLVEDAGVRRIRVFGPEPSTQRRKLRAAGAIGLNSSIVKPVDFDRLVEFAGRIEARRTMVNEGSV